VSYDLSLNHILPSKDLRELDDPSDRVRRLCFGRCTSSSQDAVVISRDGDDICVAEQRNYHLVNARTKQRIDLFPFDPDYTYPIVKRIGPSEVFISCSVSLLLIAHSFSCLSGRAGSRWACLSRRTAAHPALHCSGLSVPTKWHIGSRTLLG
jgi:hypothetical protein